MADGWPIFAEWAERDRAREAELAARKALPHYGGNKIPDSYLDAFNARTHAWLVSIGARKAEVPDERPDELPVGIQNFLEQF
jgi:hypothetical protein